DSMGVRIAPIRTESTPASAIFSASRESYRPLEGFGLKRAPASSSRRRMMRAKRLVQAIGLATVLSPLVGLPQSSSSSSPTICEVAYRVEYEQAIAHCTNQPDRKACEEAAASAM